MWNTGSDKDDFFRLLWESLCNGKVSQWLIIEQDSEVWLNSPWTQFIVSLHNRLLNNIIEFDNYYRELFEGKYYEKAIKLCESVLAHWWESADFNRDIWLDRMITSIDLQAELLYNDLMWRWDYKWASKVCNLALTNEDLRLKRVWIQEFKNFVSTQTTVWNNRLVEIEKAEGELLYKVLVKEKKYSQVLDLCIKMREIAFNDAHEESLTNDRPNFTKIETLSIWHSRLINAHAKNCEQNDPDVK